MQWKILCLPALLLATLIIAGCNSNSKIAVVNSEKAIQESEAGKAGMAYLETMSKAIQEELIALQEEAENGKDKEAAQAKLQLRLREAQQRFSAEQQQVFNKVDAQFKSALDAYRAKEKLDVILFAEAALSFNPQMDITQQIMAEMNRAKISFEPLKEEAADAPAQEEAAPAAPEAAPPAPQSNATKP